VKLDRSSAAASDVDVLRQLSGGGDPAVGDVDLKPTGANQTRVFRPKTGSSIACLFFCTYRTTEETSSSANKGFISPYVKYLTIINIMCFICNKNQLDAPISQIYFGIKL
jgi:hypothetical protein